MGSLGISKHEAKTVKRSKLYKKFINLDKYGRR